jgi:hypothetical protein
MEIKVLKTTVASKNETGTQCFEYIEGEVYDIYNDLAEVFLAEGWGEKAIDDLENQAIDNLENKQFKTKKVKNAE